MGTRPRPEPQVQDHTRPFFAECAEGRLVLPRCTACGAYTLPGAHVCPYCLHVTLEFDEVSGRGKVYSFVVFRRSFHPAFTAPYAVCVIELEEGPRLVAAVDDVRPEDLYVEMPVRASFGGPAERPVPLSFQAVRHDERHPAAAMAPALMGDG